MNHTILEMACAFKLESRRFRLKNSKKENRVTDDVVFVSLVVDLHKRQNDECEEILEQILDQVSSFRTLCYAVILVYPLCSYQTYSRSFDVV